MTGRLVAIESGLVKDIGDGAVIAVRLALTLAQTRATLRGRQRAEARLLRLHGHELGVGVGPAAGVVRRRLGGGVGGRAAARRVARAVAADVFDAAAAAAPVGAAGLGARAVAVEGVFVDDEHRVAGIRGDELEGHFLGARAFLVDLFSGAGGDDDGLGPFCVFFL